MATKKKKENIGNKVFKIFVGITLVCVGIFFLTQVFQDNKTQKELKMELSDAKAELVALQAEKESLLNQKEKLSDVNYISSVARGKYLISTSNEQIYVLPSLDE